MITGELKNKVDRLWETFWTGGITNPLSVIEQTTYLMFIHDLGDLDETHARDAEFMGFEYKSIFAGEIEFGGEKVSGELMRWSSFRDWTPERQFELIKEVVFPFMKTMNGEKDCAFTRYMTDANFIVPTPALLGKVIEQMDALYEVLDAADDKADAWGDLYEYLLSKIATSGTNGQFRTPRHIIDMMTELMRPTLDDVVCDPAFGTAGFLVSASQYVKKHFSDVLYKNDNRDRFCRSMFHGFDMDGTMLRIGAMNMMKHGVTDPTIEYRDSLSADNTDRDKYTLILANPPFKGSLDSEGVAKDLTQVCKTKKTELLFLTLFVKMLKIGGRCACIVPDGVLFGSSTAHKAIRKEIVENQALEAVISMPSGVFKPYAGVSTAILIFTKTNAGGTKNVWFYDMQADGYSLDDKRTPVVQNDIPDIIERFQHLDAEATRKRTAQSFFVPKEEIAQNGYDLSINKYKEVEYAPVEYPSTQEILGEIRELEEKITQGIKSVEAFLKGNFDGVQG